MNIVYFIDHLRPDGTQTVLSQLVNGLAARGHRQTVFCLNDSGDDELIKRLRGVGADVRIVGKVALASGYGLLSMWRWLRKAQMDVAITLLFVSDVVGRVVAKAAGVPRIVSSIRTRNVDYSSLQRWLVRATMGAAEAVIINSANVREFAINNEGARPNRIYFIPNGVCVDDYTKLNGQVPLRRELGLPTAARLIGSVGRLTWQKGFDVLLNAVSLLDREGFDLLISGVGEEDASLRALSVKLGVQKHVHFIGYRRDIPLLLSSLDLYVHPARFEGMPNAVVEAMAAACPIIATSVDGNCELLEDGIHGWVVPPEDPGALATAIAAALSDRDEARRRGIAARQRVTDHFSLDKMIAAWEKVLLGKVI